MTRVTKPTFPDSALKNQKTTSHDVALRAGVSRTTVSYVLNKVDTASISEETRLRVLAAAESLGYVPNAAARMLAGQPSKLLGLIYPRRHPHLSSHLFLLPMIDGLLAAVEEHEMRLLIDSFDDTKENAFLDLARAKQIDGLILIDTPLNERAVQHVAQNDFPVVTLGYCHPKLNSVDADNHAGVQQAIKHLLEAGHQRIACITNSPSTVENPNIRLQGYRTALEQAGVAIDPTLIVEGLYTPESGYQAMHQLLQVSAKPTAVFVASDVVAFGAMRAIQESGLSIPHDMAVVGFDDVPLAKFANPPLTTVHMPAVEMGMQAGMLLMERILDRSAISHVMLPTELVVRASSVAEKRSL